MDRQKAAVVDIGSSKVVCLAAQMVEDKLHVEAFAGAACRGLIKGRVHDVDEVVRAVGTAISRVEKELGAHLEGVVVNVSGSHIQSTTSQAVYPVVPANRVIRAEDVMAVLNNSRQILLQPGRELVMSSPREFLVDGQGGLSDPVGLTGARLECVTTLATASTEVLQDLDDAIHRAGKQVDEFLIGAFASAKGAATPDQLDIGCAVVDIGGEHTEVAVYMDGRPLACTTIPIGSEHITRDLSMLLKTGLEEAERVKLEYGSADSGSVDAGDVVEIRQVDLDQPRKLKRKAMAEIIEARMDEIARYALRAVEKSGSPAKLGGIILTGGGSLLDGADVRFAGVFRGMKVKYGAPKTHGGNSRKLQDPHFSAAVGLAKLVLEADQQEFEPVSGTKSWRQGISKLQSLFGRRS